LVAPLLFQVAIDNVLVHRILSTLDVGDQARDYLVPAPIFRYVLSAIRVFLIR